MQDFFIDFISKQLSVSLWQVKNTIELIESGATIPFIARYRKEKTGNLDEVQIADISQKFSQLNELQKRKTFILKNIEEQGKLTSELQNQIQNSWDETLIEDLYLPFKSRKKTKADIAIERGLKPLAKILMSQKGNDFEVIAEKYVKGEVDSVEDAIQGAKEIVSQWISEYINIRNGLRKLFWQKGQVYSKIVKGKETEAEKFQDYFDFSEPVKSIKSHRLLAIVRGTNEGFLKIKVEPSKEDALALMERIIVKSDCDFKEEITEAIEHAYAKILKPSLKNETLQELKQKADVEAIKVFAENLRQLLLQPPLGSYRTLAIDPGFRTGCKVVCLDANGDLLHNETIYPHPPQKEIGPAKKKIATLVAQFKIEAIAIGNGTAGRETEFFIKGIQFDRAVKVFVVNEAGASIYSASKVARDEFPQYDITVRGAVSIGRRLMDPMAELVKIDPKSIGVGQYQHDVNQKLLQTELDNVVVSSVNKVGVELNTASKYLLQYVSGIGPALAQNIVDYRTEIGAFQNRKELLKVTKLGAKAFEQCAGFLRIANGNQPLDNSSVHPERYALVEKMAKSIQTSVSELLGDEQKIKSIPIVKFVDDEVGNETLNDIISELQKPGRDPRKMVKVFEFDKTIRTIDDLEVGKELPGIVNNITNFGAFVDIGIKENGMIHISNLADEFISNPSDVIALHQHVTVEVISMDKERKRIGLKLIS